MIINEECYEGCKQSLSKWESEYAEFMKAKGLNLDSLPEGERNGSFEHEIRLLQEDISYYEAVTSGKIKLPDLNQFKVFGESIILERLAKGLTYSDVASNCQLTENDPLPRRQLRDVEIIGCEIFDYRPATFYLMLSIANTIKEASSKETLLRALELPSARGQLETDLVTWRDGCLKRKTSFKLDWQNHGDSMQNWCNELEAKLAIYNQKLESRAPLESCNFADFSEALVMWRLGKKWSYKQLAEQVGIEWIELWHHEKNSYYGATFGAMLRIAEVVEHGVHVPSDTSFETDN